MPAWFDYQLEEAEAISAAYTYDGGFIWLHKPKDSDDGETAYAVTVRGNTVEETSVTFMITLPEGYPLAGEAAFPEITAVESSDSVTYRLRKLQDIVASNVQSQLRSGYDFPILAALAPIPDILGRISAEWQSKQREQEDAAAREDSNGVAVKAKKSELDSCPRMLGRRMIFFHHIRSPYKRKCIQQWASKRGFVAATVGRLAAARTEDFRLGGMSKIGFPGCIVVEGDERDVTDYVNMVSKLNWRYMAVRGDEQVPIPPGKEVDDLRKLPIEFHEYGKDEFNAVAERCREAGLEDLFLTCMQIYGGRQEASAKRKSHKGVSG
ncbi:hypothetical protein FOZ61_010144 [Perkinsus olseni]|uniref:RWD domain-containing protein n=1 Tax=Perkinsus olseni TaxID=32597 RepID=A0A7J6MG59_PEROL|nr:hypothetical protein FOZ61_010144 [Perkinsus olseni]KAF4675998.1 hypothetical protein FOL46_008609 [Perkinsus olseni]